RVVSDRYGGIWAGEQFAKFGMICEKSAEPKSSLYQTMVPLIKRRRIALLDHPKTVHQLCSLGKPNNRRVQPMIEAPPNMHEDLINSVAGAAALCLAKSSYNLAALADMGDYDPTTTAEYRRKRQENAQYHANLLRTVGAPVRLLPREEE